MKITFNKEEQKEEILEKFKVVVNESGNAWKAYISLMNYSNRSSYGSSFELGFKVKPGDICYIDFGLAYRYECGYQHMALVVSMSNYKALVVPMTSNIGAYQKAKEGSPYLFNFPKCGKMNKDSTLFLNDMKFINTARVIEIIATINIETEIFQMIKKELVKLI